MKKIYWVVMPFLLALTGCASIVEGNHESISVDTTPVEGSECQLKNKQGTWYIPVTPGSTSIQKSSSDLEVICHKATYGEGETHVKSQVRKMTYGNVIFGGIIGVAVDMSDGAAYNYPQLIKVDLKETPPGSTDEKANKDQLKSDTKAANSDKDAKPVVETVSSSSLATTKAVPSSAK